MGVPIVIVPCSKRIVTPGCDVCMLLLQLRIACAGNSDVENVMIKEVFVSTSVSGVLIIVPLTLDGLERLFLGFSYKATTA